MQRVPMQRASTFLRSINNAVKLRVRVQRATPSLNDESRDIASSSATGDHLSSIQRSIYAGRPEQ